MLSFQLTLRDVPSYLRPFKTTTSDVEFGGGWWSPLVLHARDLFVVSFPVTALTPLGTAASEVALASESGAILRCSLQVDADGYGKRQTIWRALRTPFYRSAGK